MRSSGSRIYHGLACGDDICGGCTFARRKFPTGAPPGTGLRQTFPSPKARAGIISVRAPWGSRNLTASTFGENMCRGRNFAHGNLAPSGGTTGECLHVRNPPRGTERKLSARILALAPPGLFPVVGQDLRRAWGNSTPTIEEAYAFLELVYSCIPFTTAPGARLLQPLQSVIATVVRRQPPTFCAPFVSAKWVCRSVRVCAHC